MLITSKIKIWLMKRKIRANPFIGTKDADGTFKYKEGRFTIRYAIIAAKTPNEKNTPHWISAKIRIPLYENFLKKFGEDVADFWRYQKWLAFFQPSALAVLTLICALIYIGAVELQPGKGYIIRWVVSRAIGISPNEMEYLGGGWVRVAGGVTDSAHKKSASFSYEVNLIRVFIFGDTSSMPSYKYKGK